jgi:putative ABC transport system permease protein
MSPRTQPGPSPLRRAADALRQDARSAWRNVAGRPAFAALAIVTLALGIGANTAAFSVLHGVVLSRLPYSEPERLVRIAEVRPDGGTMALAGANFEDWEERARGFEALAAYGAWRTTVLGGARPALVETASVSEGFFDTMGVAPAIGRRTLPEEHREGADPAAVVSRRFWRGALGGGSLDGVTLDVAGFDVRVVGVMPAGFDFPEGTDLWYPLELHEPNTSRTSHNFDGVARLAPGVNAERAEADLDALTRRIVADEPASDYLAVGARVTPLLDDIAGPVRRPLMLLFGAAVLVLLVACSNLASAFLARGLERQREMAVRVSLGAGRGRLLRQLFAESLLVALAGAAAGLALAWGALELVRGGAGEALPRLGEIGLHGPVLGFTLAVSIATAVLFGVLPGLRLVQSSPSQPLHQARAASADPGRRRAWRALVAAEVALSMVLLAGSGLMLKSLWQVLSEDPGFDPDRVVAATVHLPASQYPEGPDRRAFYDRLLGELAARPEIETAGVLSDLPLSGSGSSGRIDVEAGVVPHLDAEYRLAGGDAFAALGVPLVAGRPFESRDDAAAPHVAIVNRAMAEAAWPGEDPLGQRVTGGGMDEFWDQETWATVIGVVADVRQQDLTRADRPTVYFPYAQRPRRMWAGSAVVRLAGEAGGGGDVLGAAVRAADPQVPYELQPMGDVIAGSVASRRFQATLLGAFALVGLLLAAVGIYGVVSYTVAQRKKELGIRLALGATPPRVRNQVLAGSMATVGIGIVLGLAASLAGGRLLASLLYDVAPTDPATLGATAAILAAIALGAAWLPAQETVRIDPLETLKSE